MSEEVVKELKLLNHQYELFIDTDTKVLGLVSGVGGGKSWIIARKAVQLAMASPGCDGIMTEPSFPLIVQILIPELHAAFKLFNIPYTFNKVEAIFYLNIGGVETRIILKSIEQYEKLVGINAAWVICDEFDISRQVVGYNAYLKLHGRIRVGNQRQMILVSTPEGFKTLYKIFVTEAGKGKRLIKAKTTDNHHLPDDFIETMMDNYPANLVDAYINGEFVNLTSGSVYASFNRTTCNSSEKVDGDEQLYVSQDFNVHNNCSVVFVKRGAAYHAVDEITGAEDTPESIRLLKSRYPRNRITLYPDASGRANKSVNASVSDIGLFEQAGFIINAPSRNGPIKDRIISVNNAFEHNTIYVNVNACPALSMALEQQAYTDNGIPDKSADGDDVNDSFGYFVVRTFPIVRPSSKISITFSN